MTLLISYLLVGIRSYKVLSHSLEENYHKCGISPQFLSTYTQLSRQSLHSYVQVFFNLVSVNVMSRPINSLQMKILQGKYCM